MDADDTKILSVHTTSVPEVDMIFVLCTLLPQYAHCTPLQPEPLKHNSLHCIAIKILNVYSEHFERIKIFIKQ